MSTADRKWDARARDLEFEELATVRKTAESWRTGLAALTAIVTAAAIVKGQDEFDKLSSNAQGWVTFFFVATVVALVAGTFSAMRAAFGLPARMVNSGEALKSWTRRESRCARRHLFAAQFCTTIGLTFLVALILTTWHADPAEKTKSTVKVTLSDSTVVCGEVKSSVNGSFEIKVDDTTTVTVLTADVLKLEITACDTS